jgi:hypothetical protein
MRSEGAGQEVGAAGAMGLGGFSGGHLRRLALCRNTPRYGAGPKTALCASAAVWGSGTCWLRSHRFTPSFPETYGYRLAVGLVEVLVGTVAGVWLYREVTA